ncbi:peptidoglycan-binding protein [Oscillatoria sp. FACHB-1407]|nr:peptidoglycan-binding protein [Oscillatoria sp. FACHB-1407]MBD2464702.1 peptidoglycan-binding protein [Oscillatoria sp. FACHB-1407]
MSGTPEFAHAVSNVVLMGPELHPWDSGPVVAELQELLQAHGFQLRIDGDFGSVTEAAVKAFQRLHHLRADGIVGHKTWIALKSSVQAGCRTLKYGHTGVDVYELQGLLQVQGQYIARNGIFDAATQQAVIAFQKKHRHKETGIVDAITWTTLRGGKPLCLPPKQTGWFYDNRKWW